MNANPYSGTDVAFSGTATKRPSIATHGSWTIQEGGMIAHVPRNELMRLSVLTDDTSEWSMPRIQVFQHCGLAVSIYQHDQLPATELADPWSTPDSLTVSRRPMLSESARYSSQRFCAVVHTTDAQVVEYADQFADMEWVTLENPVDLDIVLEEVISLAAGEHFEDGIETRFSRAIGWFILSHRFAAIDSIGKAIKRNIFRDTYVAEALLWIGELDDDETEYARRGLLEAACGSNSVTLRDAAVSGLSYLGAAGSKERLEKMLKVERVKGIRANIEAVLAYLRD